MNVNSKDWFEFILDLNLLDNYFKDSIANNDVLGSYLIIQFLYHANMTEQVYGNPMLLGTNGAKSTEPAELKVKKIRILRVLAIKMACILKWNIMKFEKEIPVAVMSDLLHNFLRIAMNGEQKLHSQLEIECLDDQAVFALQLLHRWCVRVIIFSKYPKRAIAKATTITAPGIVNPLQHMKDANENILRVLATSVQESVDFLEKLIKQLSRDICVPTSQCFVNLTAESGSYDVIWNNSQTLKLSTLKSLISFDLGIYYFQQGNYEKALEYLQQVDQIRSKFGPDEDLEFLNVYFNDLNGYLVACRSMLEPEDPQIFKDDPPYKIVQKKMVAFEKNQEQHAKEAIEVLIEDNLRSELSLSYRENLEEILKDQEILQEEICSCNAAKFAMDSSYFSPKSNLSFIARVYNNTIDKLPIKQKIALCSYIQLNYKKLSEILCEPLKSNSYLILKSPTINKTPFLSHSFIYFNFEQRYLTSSIYSPLNYGKFILQRSDPQGIKYCLGRYSSIFESCEKSNKQEIYVKYGENQYEKSGFREFERKMDAELLSAELRNFWPNWKTDAVRLLTNKLDLADRLLDEHLKDMLKHEHRKELDFIVICIAKIIELKSIKKYDSAMTLLVALSESNAFKNQQMIYDIGLYINVSKYLCQIDFDAFNLKSRVKPSIEMIFKDCREFFSFHKNYSEIPQEIVRTISAFVVSIGEFDYLTSLSLGSIGKNNFLTLIKHVSKLCTELEKTDKSNMRKVARTVWDFLIEVFNDKVSSKRTNSEASQADFLAQNSAVFSDEQASIREALRNSCLMINNVQVSNILISALSTIYSIADSTVNTEIFSEYRHLWPSSLGNSSTLNTGYIQDLMNAMLHRHLNIIEPFDANCIRTVADINLSQGNYQDSIKFFLQVFVCVSKYFFKFENLEKKDETNVEELSEKCVKAMMNSSLRLNKHTHAALLSQIIENNDYQLIFKSLQERTNPTTDEMDEAYDCLWDISLIEFLTYLNASRGFIDKRNICLKLCSSTSINAANPNEIFDKTVEIKKTNLFMKLLKYYILL